MQIFKSLFFLVFFVPFFLSAGGEESLQEMEVHEYGFDRYPSIYDSNAHHWLCAVTLLDNDEYSLELEDGSQWKMSSYDGSKALNWEINDPLVITQNSRWFSKHEYKIINQENGASVEASLFLGPLLHGEYSRYIIRIDPIQCAVWLNDDTGWDVSYLDVFTFKDWAEGDHIILGTNSDISAFFPRNDALLINVNLNNKVRAKPLGK